MTNKMDERIYDVSFYDLKADEVLHKLDASEKGLKEEEAKKRKEKFGSNKLQKSKQKSLFQIFISQINNPIVYLLVGAAVISFIFKDIPEAIAILVVIALNTIVGFWMEYQAKISMNALKKMDKLKANVYRSENQIEIDAENLVPGDIIFLEAGNLIPADARLIKVSEFAVDESPLTGESVPVNKSVEKLPESTQLADRENMVYKGTAATSGNAKAVIVATAQHTEIGKISEMVKEAEEDSTPLNKKLEGFSKKLIWVTLGLAALFFIFGYIAGKDIYKLLQTAIAWTVAAIPEGLPIVASIALARGMLRLAKENVIVKKLAAVETLGETTTVFTDKTGTLTENKLTVDTIAIPGKSSPVNWKENKQTLTLEDISLNDDSFTHIFRLSVLCNNAELDDNNQGKGDPLEVALLDFTKKLDHSHFQSIKKWERINEDPFDSEAKMMSTVHENEETIYIAAKGAMESILEKSEIYLKDGQQKKMTQDFKNSWMKKNNELSAQGLRVIAFAYRKGNHSEKQKLKEKENFADTMIFVGAIGFIDPPKEGIEESISTCHKAGIKIVMVTGDHPETAVTIAEKIDLLEKDSKKKALKGKDVDKLAEEKLNNQVKLTDYEVFARVDPSQKLEIVEMFQKKGEITGMTGDGINDAPALKKANIGIAMGKRGTQVAQDVADMVLKDDSFSSIVKAIRQGRIIFENIRKFIMYQLSYHLAEIIIIAGISFSMLYLPLLPLQLLFLNLLSDVFPALALGLSKGNVNIMNKNPKNPEEPIITKKNWTSIFVYGISIAAFVTAAYLTAYYGFNLEKEICNNIAFFSLAISQLLHVFNMREPSENIFINQVSQNKYIWMALAFCVIALIAAYTVPLLSDILSFQQLTHIPWIIIAATSLLNLFTIQMLKQIFKL